MRERYIQDFKAIESTLREGEQFAGANSTTEQMMRIAQAPDAFGVQYLELTSPVVSPQSYMDIRRIAGVGLRAKILTHIRCSRADAARAMELPVDGVDIPFNNHVTGMKAFTRKAGIHAKAILNDRRTYEILDPEDFGLTRHVSITLRLTGWHAVKWRAQQRGIAVTEDRIGRVTAHVKALADEKPLSLDDVDAVLKRWGVVSEEALSPRGNDRHSNAKER